jgi:hypothetical protein
MKKLLMLVAMVIGGVVEAGAPANGTVSCPASGAKVVSTTGKKFAYGVIQAPSGNAGNIFVGSSSVTTTPNAAGFAATGSITFPPQANAPAYDLGQIYFACSNSADSIVYTIVQ